MRTTEELIRAFGNDPDPERAADWEGVKAGLRVGSRLSGTVVARYIFGLFIDLGVGFPALLPITQFHPSPRRRPVVIEDYPEIGGTATVRVVSFRDSDRQIGLTQLDPHPYLDGGAGDRIDPRAGGRGRPVVSSRPFSAAGSAGPGHSVW